MNEIITSLPQPYYTTDYGAAYLGDALELLEYIPDGQINLIMTSPPFALNKKKPYGKISLTKYL